MSVGSTDLLHEMSTGSVILDTSDPENAAQAVITQVEPEHNEEWEVHQIQWFVSAWKPDTIQGEGPDEFPSAMFEVSERERLTADPQNPPSGGGNNTWQDVEQDGVLSAAYGHFTAPTLQAALGNDSNWALAPKPFQAQDTWVPQGTYRLQRGEINLLGGGQASASDSNVEGSANNIVVEGTMAVEYTSL